MDPTVHLPVYLLRAKQLANGCWKSVNQSQISAFPFNAIDRNLRRLETEKTAAPLAQPLISVTKKRTVGTPLTGSRNNVVLIAIQFPINLNKLLL